MAPTKSYERNCFQEHIRESIAINKDRMGVYGKLTNGESDRIFRKLIAYEYLTLIPAAYYDLRARAYQLNGVELLSSELVSMLRTPSFSPEERVLPADAFISFDWSIYKAQILKAIGQKDLSKIKLVTLSAIEKLEKAPSFYCFSRHFMESIYRFAYFAPIRAQEAEELDLKDPTPLMLEIMKLHTLGIKDCYEIDLWARPIQERGIPILRSEIPDLMSDLH